MLSEEPAGRTIAREGVRIVWSPSYSRVLRIEIDLEPFTPSLKNSRRLIPVGTRTIPIMSARAQEFSKRFKARLAIAFAGVGLPVWPAESIRRTYRLDLDSMAATLVLEPLGAHPREALRKQNKGRIRDLSNTLELVDDLLEGIVYEDDAQIAAIDSQRIIGGQCR